MSSRRAIFELNLKGLGEGEGAKVMFAQAEKIIALYWIKL